MVYTIQNVMKSVINFEINLVTVVPLSIIHIGKAESFLRKSISTILIMFEGRYKLTFPFWRFLINRYEYQHSVFGGHRTLANYAPPSGAIAKHPVGSGTVHSMVYTRFS